MKPTVLRLGHKDQESVSKAASAFLTKLRAEGKKLEEIAGSRVNDLQQFLIEAGFLLNANSDGIYDHRTQTAVRQFQKYVGTVEGNPRVSTPNGRNAHWQT